MARNKELNQRLRDERRQQLLSTALRLFATQGLAATKISHIANEVGISQGLLYHYYKSKEEIYTELIQQAFAKLNEACTQLEAMPVSAAQKIRLAFKELLLNLQNDEDAALYHLLVARATVSEAIPDKAKAIIRKQNKIPYEVMTRIFQTGLKAGSVKKQDPRDLALIFWTSLKGLAMHRAVHGPTIRLPHPDMFMPLFFQE